MAHIHLPDGILPIWLWGMGWIVLIGYFFLFGKYFKNELGEKAALAAVFAAIMVIAQSFEIVPIAYHFNLSVVSGIFIGPLWIVVISFIVNLILSMFGHGGITVVAINSMLVAAEGIAGFYLFRGLKYFINDLARRVFFTTLMALLLSTSLAIFIVSLGSSGLSFEAGKFIPLVLFLGAIGWGLEAFLSSAIVVYLAKIRPDLLK